MRQMLVAAGQASKTMSANAQKTIKITMGMRTYCQTDSSRSMTPFYGSIALFQSACYKYSL
jgi:hypothetical protein